MFLIFLTFLNQKNLSDHKLAPPTGNKAYYNSAFAGTLIIRTGTGYFIFPPEHSKRIE